MTATLEEDGALILYAVQAWGWERESVVERVFATRDEAVAYMRARSHDEVLPNTQLVRYHLGRPPEYLPFGIKSGREWCAPDDEWEPAP